jgi:GNAT superfamily N-acetyltransferase
MQQQAMSIRRATPTDARDIADVHVRSWKSAYPGLLPQDYLDALQPEDRLGSWETVLAATDWPRAGIFLLVDSVDGIEHVRGFSHICPTRDADMDPATTGEITSVYLAPEAWGGGNGVALMEISIDQLVFAGYQTASLWALDTNARARRFYEIGGWRHDGTTKIHDWGPFVCTDVRYVLDLTERPARPGVSGGT